jgi:hypothetical protein
VALIALMFLLPTGAARPLLANPCPCREQFIAGRHLYVGEPQKEVRIQSEKLLFQVQRPTSWLHDIVVEVSVDYVLANQGGARQLVIGFPVGFARDLSSFQVAGDGVGARVVPDGGQQKEWVSAAHPSECEVEASAEAAGETYGWYLWKQSLHAGVNRLRVRYLQRWFVQNGEVTVDYVLQTARAWGSGQIGNLHIELRDPDRPAKLRWKATPQPTEVRDGGRLLVWSLTNHRPARDLQMHAVFRPGPEDMEDQ